VKIINFSVVLICPSATCLYEIGSMCLTDPWTKTRCILRLAHTRYFSVEIARDLSELSFAVIVPFKENFFFNPFLFASCTDTVKLLEA
jgi:hypothetical protein